MSERPGEDTRQKVKAGREHMGSGNQASQKRMNLTGKNAILEPGGQITIRLLPRWDFKNAYLKEGGGWVTNPDYKGGPVCFEAWEHWWDGEGGTWHRGWCLRTFDRNVACPLCTASEQMKRSPDPDDRRCGLDLAPREVFLFNAVVKDLSTQRCALTQAGAPDIKVLCAQITIFVSISSLMTGGEDEFAKGDITNPGQGYDINLRGPAGLAGRWKVDCAPEPSPICAEDQRAAWKDWPNILIDLPGWVAAGMKSYEELHRAYFKQYPLSTEMSTRQ